MLLLLAPLAHGFSIADHRRITEAALANEPALAPHARRIVRGSGCEDLDLIAKWSRWSHYDKPTGEVRGRRRRSDERVEHLWAKVDLGAPNPRTWRRIGRIVHHVQDMAVPSHVVPVQHGPFDGYERFPHPILAVSDPIAAASPAEAHAAVAWDTWTAIGGVADLCGREVPWTAFWAPREGRFGAVGEERFGRGEDCGTFASFDADRVRAALVGTAAVLARVAELAAESPDRGYAPR